MHFFTKSVVILGAAFALMGCEPAPEAELSAAPTEQSSVAAAAVSSQAKPSGFSAYNYQWFPVLVGVESGQGPVRLRGLDSAKLRKALKQVDDNDCGDFKKCGKNAGKKLNGSGNQGKASKFTGIGASGVATLVSVAENTDVGADVKIWSKGRILDRCLDENGAPQPGRKGYSYYEPSKNLRICVVVRTTTENANGVNVSKFEYFEVEAKNVEYEERCPVGGTDPRCVSASAGNVFPKAKDKTKLSIPDSKTRPVAGVQLNWKLYGWGDNIKVVRYGLVPAMTWTSTMAPTPTWDATNIYSKAQGHGQLTQMLKKLFAENNAACVDMMFVDRPPAELGEDERVVYCLGRCDQPPILNTL